MQDFLTGIFSSGYYIGSMLNMFVLMTIAGLGNCICLKAGFFNLGGEGQVYLGGFAAAICLDAFKFLPPVLNIILSLAAALIASGLLAGISALLNSLKNASVLLTTFLCSAAVIPVIDYLVSGPLRTKTGNLLCTAVIPQAVQLSSILKPSPLNLSITIIPLLCFCVWYVMYRTNTGRRMQLFGQAREFALYCGYSARKNVYGSMIAAGMFHGLCGFIAVTGTYFSCPQGFYTGMGWNALSASLFCNAVPSFLVIPSLILSWLYTSASRYSLLHNLGYDISGILQGIVVFIVSAITVVIRIISQKKNISEVNK